MNNSSLKHPDGAWGWGAAVAATAVCVVPVLMVLVIVPEARSVAMAARSAGLVLQVVMISSGIFMYLHHRLTNADSTAWLACALIAVGFIDLTVAGVELSSPSAQPGARAILDLALVVSLVAVVRISERMRFPADPAAVGLAIGIVGSVVAVTATSLGSTRPPTTQATAVVAAALVALGTVVAVEVHRLVTMPTWMRDRLAIAVAALFVGRAGMVVDLPSDVVPQLVAVAAWSVAATLLLGTSLAALRLGIRDDRVVITALQDQLVATAEDARADRDRLHEVRGTIAGIASASRLIHQEHELPGNKRELLEEMLERESARLQRLVDGNPPGPVGLIPLDDILRPLVAGRRAQGQVVTWYTSGARAWACEDDLTEIVSILLDNAARHAPGAPVAIYAQESEGGLELVVADAGPGIPEHLRESAFQRGARGDGSKGDGLGLYLARELAMRIGGSLRLEEPRGPGAAFVIGLRGTHQLAEGRRHDSADQFAS